MKHRIFGGSTTNGYTKNSAALLFVSKKKQNRWQMDLHAPFYISPISSNTHHSASTPLGSRAHSIFCHCPRGSARRRGAGPGPFSGSVAVPLHPKNITYVQYHLCTYLFMFEPLRKIKKTTIQLQTFNHIYIYTI